MNRLYYGDNLEVMRRFIRDESVDLVYLDPPFKSDKNYNVLFKNKEGEKEPGGAQALAFEDTWTWGVDDEALYEDLIVKSEPGLSATLQALFRILGKSDMMSYIVMMAPRLVEIRRVLSTSGSVYLHCDMSASHYLKILMDSVFGVNNFLNNVVWLYGLGGSSNRYWPRKHDDILWYSRTPNGQFFEADRVPARSQKMKGMDKKAPDYWDIPAINNMAKERLGYPTQKPVALLDRIVNSSCPERGVVLDPFCGCGTAVVSAEKNNRAWIGIDVSFLAIDLIRDRLKREFGDTLKKFEVHGEPKDVQAAVALFERNPFDFERWIVTLVGGFPNEKQRGDGGVDGRIRYWSDSDELSDMLVSVKGGKALNPSMIRDLAGTMKSMRADMGLLITLSEPTRGMRDFAAKEGAYRHYSGNTYPRLQILTVAEILAGKKPDMPTVKRVFGEASPYNPEADVLPGFEDGG